MTIDKDGTEDDDEWFERDGLMTTFEPLLLSSPVITGPPYKTPFPVPPGLGELALEDNALAVSMVEPMAESDELLLAILKPAVWLSCLWWP